MHETLTGVTMEADDFLSILQPSPTPSFSTDIDTPPPTPHNNTDLILQRLSDERALELLPVFVIFGLVFLLGVLGNTLTVYIYWAKFKVTWSRTAIVTLGIFDLISCLVAVPGEVLDLRFSFNYNSDFLCRLSRACSTFPNVASGIMLSTVAFDRYRLICSPHKSSASRSHAWKHVLVVCSTSLMVTWPAAIIYGTMTIDTGISHVTGLECSTSDLVKGTKFPLVYQVVLAVVFLSAFTAMIVFYSCIGRQIYRQGEFRKTLLNLRDRRRRSTQSDLETSLASDPDAGGDLSHGNSSENHQQHSAHHSDRSKEESTEMKRKGEPLPSSPTRNEGSLPSSPTNHTSPNFLAPNPHRKLNHTPSILKRIRKKNIVDSRTRKTTVMLCFISIIFVLSFLPHLAVKLIQILDKEFLKEASTVRLIAYNLSARSYFLNSFINVFIYGFCSFRFRKECRKALKKLLRWESCCRQ